MFRYFSVKEFERLAPEPEVKMSVVAMMSPLWQALTGAMKGAVMFLLAQQVWRQHKGHSQRNSLTWNLIRLNLSVAHHWFHCLKNEWQTNADSLYFVNASEGKYIILKLPDHTVTFISSQFHCYFPFSFCLFFDSFADPSFSKVLKSNSFKYV